MIKRILFSTYFGSLFLLGLWLTTAALAEKVTYVIDGDTVIMDDHQRVRLIGIDAPEIDSRYHRGEYFGRESGEYLKKRIEGREVVLKPGSEPFDKYGRRLAFIYLPDGTFINEEMVRLGFAETFRSFPFPDREKFLALEDQAREKELGMWGKRKRPWWLRGFSRKKS